LHFGASAGQMRGAVTKQMPARRRARRAADRRLSGYVARALPAGLGACSQMQLLFFTRPLTMKKAGELPAAANGN